MSKILKGILTIILIFIVMPIVADFLANVITIEMIMKVVYVALAILGVYFVKEGM